jgi:hypothetical protein
LGTAGFRISVAHLKRISTSRWNRFGRVLLAERNQETMSAGCCSSRVAWPRGGGAQDSRPDSVRGPLATFRIDSLVDERARGTFLDAMQWGDSF